MSQPMKCGCGAAKQADGTYAVVITVENVPRHLVNEIMEALHDPVRAAIAARFSNLSATVRTPTTFGQKN